MTDAANLGNLQSQQHLAELYFSGEDGVEKDVTKAAYYFTLAYSNVKVVHSYIGFEDRHELDFKPAYNLGRLFWGEHGSGGLEVSMVLAKLYSEEALKIAKTEPTPVYLVLAGALVALREERYGKETKWDGIALPGLCLGSKIQYCIRKFSSIDVVGIDNLEDLHASEEYVASFCSLCCKRCATGEKFKRCSKCHHASYCSKECQIKDWNLRHKIECIPSFYH